MEEGLRDTASTSTSAKKDKAKAEPGNGSGSGSSATPASTVEQPFIPRAAMSGKSRPRAGLGSSKRSRMTEQATGSSQTRDAPKFISEDRSQQKAAADADVSKSSGAQPAGLGQDAFRQMLAGKK